LRVFVDALHEKNKEVACRVAPESLKLSDIFIIIEPECLVIELVSPINLRKCLSSRVNQGVISRTLDI